MLSGVYALFICLSLFCVQGTLTEGEGSVQFTSLYLLVKIRLFWKYDLPLLQCKQPYWGGQLYWAFPFS
jgi:hypothetical protein